MVRLMEHIITLYSEDIRGIIAERYGVEIDDVRIEYGGCAIGLAVTLKDE